MQFTPTAGVDKYLTYPYQAMQGVHTLLLFYQPQFPASNDTASFARTFLLRDCAHNGPAIVPSRFGEIALWNQGTNLELVEATDRLVGNAAIAFVTPASGNAIAYPYGHGPQSYLFQSSQANYFNCSTGDGNIGADTFYAGSGYSGRIYAILGFSQTFTAQEVQQATKYVSNVLQQKGVGTFADYVPANYLQYDGDSRTQFYSKNYLQGSRPWEISKLEPGRDQFYNTGIAGQTVTTINSKFSAVTCPLLRRASTVSKLITFDAITNDITTGACTTAAGCFALIQTYGTNAQTCSPGIALSYATSLPRSDLTLTQETLREATMALVSSNALAGTFNFAAVDDIAGDPIAATQVLPNNYATSGAAAYCITGITRSASRLQYHYSRLACAD